MLSVHYSSDKWQPRYYYFRFTEEEAWGREGVTALVMRLCRRDHGGLGDCLFWRSWLLNQMFLWIPDSTRLALWPHRQLISPVFTSCFLFHNIYGAQYRACLARVSIKLVQTVRNHIQYTASPQPTLPALLSGFSIVLIPGLFAPAFPMSRFREDLPSECNGQLVQPKDEWQRRVLCSWNKCFHATKWEEALGAALQWRRSRPSFSSEINQCMNQSNAAQGPGWEAFLELSL